MIAYSRGVSAAGCKSQAFHKMPNGKSLVERMLSHIYGKVVIRLGHVEIRLDVRKIPKMPYGKR